jgi:hypothetical protein
MDMVRINIFGEVTTFLSISKIQQGKEEQINIECWKRFKGKGM